MRLDIFFEMRLDFFFWFDNFKEKKKRKKNTISNVGQNHTLGFHFFFFWFDIGL
jgi:hypothetical protein